MTEPKYKIGDKVWMMKPYPDNCTECVIEELTITKTVRLTPHPNRKEGVSFYYVLTDGTFVRDYEEGRIFPSKQALIESL